LYILVSENVDFLTSEGKNAPIKRIIEIAKQTVDKKAKILDLFSPQKPLKEPKGRS